MVLIIIIAFISLVILIILHEFGHFILAKKFGVKVEEFGLGYPPRLFGKKIGETLYSLNLLPFGGFVKIFGQEKRIDKPRSFTIKPSYQKALIILGGVVSFWVVAAILLSVVMGIGAPTVVEDEETQGLVDPKIQITAIASNSPAEEAGLKLGDTIMSISGADINKVKEVQGFTQAHKGEEIILTIQRGKEVFDVSLIPRAFPPENEGPMGVALARTALKSYPWHQAPIKGIVATCNLTLMIIKTWGITIMNLFQGKGVPAGVEVRGIVGIFGLFIQVGAMGVSYFLQFIAMISVSLALINILPIPALDGGWLLFLVIEKLKGRPLNQKIVQNISLVSFFLLVALMIWVTIKDIAQLF